MRVPVAAVAVALASSLAVALKVPPAFAAPNGKALNLKGFCQRPDKKPACTQQPCCCWSTFAADKHPAYPSPDEVTGGQSCLNPPAGFTYSPEPGNTFAAGYLETLKKASLPVYAGRRLCCLRTSLGVKEESQQDLSAAIKKAPKRSVVAVAAAPAAAAVAVTVPEPGQVDPAFKPKEQKKVVALKSGAEFETAKMEQAAQAHLTAANSLTKTAASLEASANAIADVNHALTSDPTFVRKRKRVQKMRSAVKAWSKRRWANLKKLEEASK